MSDSRVFEKVNMCLMEARLIKLSFDRREVVRPGTQHRQTVSINQTLTIVSAPDEGLIGIGKARMLVESQLLEPERPHFQIECEYGGVFKVLDAEPGLHANAKVSDSVVDAVCGYILPLVTAEIALTLQQSGLKLEPKVWSMQGSRELMASGRVERNEILKKKRAARPKK